MRIDPLTRRAFALLARLRGAPAFHPKGVAFEATLAPVPGLESGLPLFDSGPRQAVVRLSRGIGLPESLPDLFGFALRVPDAYGPGRHQDLLLTTGFIQPLLRHLLWPAGGVAGRPYTSLAPYRAAGRTVTLLARGTDARGDRSLGGLREEGPSGLTFALGLGAGLGGFEHLADVVPGGLLDDVSGESIGFDPGNTGGGLELTGLINRLRLPAYAGSRRGRDFAGAEGQ